MRSRPLHRRPLRGITALCCLLAFHAHATHPDNPPVTECECPEDVDLISQHDTDDEGNYKLKASIDGTFEIEVMAVPPDISNPPTPTLTLRDKDGMEIASEEAWQYKFTFAASGLKSPITLEVTVPCTDYGSDNHKICEPQLKFVFGCDAGDCGSDSDGSCQSGTGSPSGGVQPGSEEPFQFSMPIGSDSQGDETTGLHFNAKPGTAISISDFKIHSNGGHTKDGNDITTGTTKTTLSEANGVVTVSITKTGDTVAFKTYVFTSDTAAKTLTMVETSCGQDPVTHQWKENSGTFSYSTANGMRVKTAIVEQNQNFVRVERHKVLEKVGGNDVLVSDERLHYRTSEWGNRLIKREVDPTGENLTSTWTYGKSTDGNAYGRLMEHVRHDGLIETHTYTNEAADKGMHKIDYSDGRSVLTTWFAGTTEVTEKIGTTVVSKTKEIRNGNTLVVKRFTDDNENNALVTNTTYKPAGLDFGGMPSLIVRPDGTATKYNYIRTTENNAIVRKVTVENGLLVSGNITDGTRTVTTTNPQGQIIEEKITDIATDIVLAHTKGVLPDGHGRPTYIRHFPVGEGEQESYAYQEHRSYSCCGLVSETDRHGVTTLHAYDALKRRVRTNRLDVTTETHYKGLVTETYRYHDKVTGTFTSELGGTSGDLIAREARNVAGTLHESETPNPTSAVAGTLILSRSTGTEYAPAAGLSRRVTTTVPGNHSQIEDFDLAGRLVKSTGDLSPAMEYAYTATYTGLLTARAYLDGANHREITSTLADWAGRVKRQGWASSMTTTRFSGVNYAYIPSTGQLLSTKDADGVTTLYAYNALGERTTTALKLDNATTITYGTDQITRTETKPALRQVGTDPVTEEPIYVSVMRTETSVWQNGNDTEEAHTLVSYSERAVDGTQSWSWQIGGTEAHSAATAISVIGINFCDNVPQSQLQNRTADGLARWTDSWQATAEFFPNGTDVSLTGSDSVRVSWQSSDGAAAGSSDHAAQAPYYKYLKDSQTNPAGTVFGGTDTDGIGVRVRITGLDDWLAENGHTSYQIRAYASSDTANGTFQTISIHDDNAGGQVLGTITPVVKGQAEYPTGYGGDPEPRGYGDSAADFTAATITLTIPVAAANARGTLAALKITGLGTNSTFRPTGSWTETTAAPDGTRTVTTYSGGHPLSMTRYGTDNAPLHTVFHGYDLLNRPSYSIDSRTGLTTTTYISATADYVKSITDSGYRTTSFIYDSRGRQITTTLPATTQANVIHTTYTPRGEPEARWGSQTYPEFRTYDYAGRLKTLRTKPDFNQQDIPINTGGSLTTWKYYTATGLLWEKIDDQLKGSEYTYTAAGRLQTRKWAREVSAGVRITTTYGYIHGRLTSVTYNDDTPNLGYTHDTLGRIRTVIQGAINTHTYAYKDDLHDHDDDPETDDEPYGTGLGLHSETVNYGTGAPARTIIRNEDGIQRPSGWQLKDGGTVEHAVAYGYDTAGRLNRVHPAYPLPEAPTSPDFTYHYENNSFHLLSSVVGPAHTVTNLWDYTRDVLDTKFNTDTVGTNTLVSSFHYSVNAIGQRTSVAPAPVPESDPAIPPTYGVAWTWLYNGRGELVSADHGSDELANPHDRFYEFDMIGNRNFIRNGTSTDDPLVTPINYTANSLNQYTGSDQNLIHDADGNLEEGALRYNSLSDKDGTSYTATLLWDAENHLVEILDDETAMVAYSYDYLGRRISRTAGGTTTWYFYDGWNLIAEYAGTTLSKSYTWGIDLSGTMQGAGGVGGLLSVRHETVTGKPTFYPCYDGNGNVTEYLNEDGEAEAHFEYDPFGRLIVSTDTTGDFSIRFSTKMLEDKSGLYYYGYRYYDPVTGRWPSRDPIQERGGINLYGFVRNDGVNAWDIYGLSPYTTFESALEAARDELGGLTATSRLLGTFELGGLQPSIVFPEDMLGNNYTLFVTSREKDIMYRGVVGVEYGTYIYCDESLGVFDYAPPKRGKLPSKEQLFSQPEVYGTMSIPIPASSPDRTLLALIHTHNVSYVYSSIHYNDGLLSHTITQPINGPASDADRESASINQLPNYVVGEKSFGTYFIIEIANF